MEMKKFRWLFAPLLVWCGVSRQPGGDRGDEGVAVERGESDVDGCRYAAGNRG